MRNDVGPTAIIVTLWERLRPMVVADSKHEEFASVHFWHYGLLAAVELCWTAKKIAVARFAAAARDEVDLDTLTAELVEVIEETVQPEHVSLWLIGERPGEK